MVQDEGLPEIPQWERDLVRQAVESQFAERHRDDVFAELGRMREAWFAATGAARVDAEQLARLVVRAQLDVIAESAGDPAYLTEEHYRQSAGGELNRDRLCVLDQIVKDRQL